jgi:exonuclease III
LKGRFQNYSLISAHAPTEKKNENEKDAFYDTFERTYENCPSNDVKIIFGDFNAKIGQDKSARPTTGMNSLHKEHNDN